MAINTLAFASKFAGELDKLFVQSAATGFFADNVLKAKFVGAKTVIIPDLELQGLGDYNRDDGFVNGSITVNQTSYTLSQDRARSFQIDREDEDETGIANLAGQVMGEFVRTKVAPETDAYVLSKLATMATTKSHLITGTPASSAFKMLSDAIIGVQGQCGFDEALVAFVNPTFYAALMNSTDASRSINIGEFSKGGINTKVKTYNDVPIIPVAADRMKTAFTFNDGSTGGQTAGGFVPASEAKDVGFIVIPKKGASLVKKTEKIRVFSPDQNQTKDAYKFDYRLYYDLLLKKSQQNNIYAYTY